MTVPYNFHSEKFMEEHRRKCPICGKLFWSSAEWVYKIGHKNAQQIFCSWKCMRAEEKKNMTITDKISQAIRDGLTDNEIKKMLGVTQRQIDFKRRKGT